MTASRTKKKESTGRGKNAAAVMPVEDDGRLAEIMVARVVVDGHDRFQTGAAGRPKSVLRILKGQASVLGQVQTIEHIL